MGFHPVLSALRTAGLVFRGRLHIVRDQIGAVFTTDKDQRFVVFRHVEVAPAPGRPMNPGAVFLARFHLAGMSPRLNAGFSLLPIPCFVGLPGFRPKRSRSTPRTGRRLLR